jgi:hypothetical protein
VKNKGQYEVNRGSSEMCATIAKNGQMRSVANNNLRRVMRQ